MNNLEDDEIVLKVEQDPLIGKVLAGRYQIVSVLGRGGMGVVYKAVQQDTERQVALKTLHLGGTVDLQVIQKFRSEAQAVSKVRHPNTVMLYDFGVSDNGVPFIVMELISGVSFREIVKSHAPILNLGRLFNVFQQVCSALAGAHEQGIVHRDLKPENIMMGQKQGQDWVYVLDFGIAGMVQGQNERRDIVGSPPYMSPEQCSGTGAIDQRSDIYSLGVCLFEALTGKYPFQARTAMEMMDCHIKQKPRLVKEVDAKFGNYESLSLLIAKAMEKNPAKRQQSVIEFAAEFEDAIKKDSKRGMPLKDRATMEIISAPRKYTPKTEQEKEKEKAIEPGYMSVFTRVQTFMQGENSPRVKMTDAQKEEERLAREEKERERERERMLKEFEEQQEREKEREAEKREAVEAGRQSYFSLSVCPHCGAQTKKGIALCLECGRSLAAKSDISKIRASKGEFSLGKVQEYGDWDEDGDAPKKGFSKKSRLAMMNAGRTRAIGIAAFLAAVLALAYFFFGKGLH